MVLGLWFESVRVMFFLCYYSNALPVPMLRQVSMLSAYSEACSTWKAYVKHTSTLSLTWIKNAATSTAA